jgi:pimeloyl-ACP methyl ester carboxylesterase
MVDRRNFLGGGLAIAGAVAMAEPAAAAPKPATFVLVHGAWHNALHWQSIAVRLAALGHRVVAPDLPAHGLRARFPASYVASDNVGFATEVSPVKDVTLEDAAQAVVATVTALGGAKPILVGHSLGGAVVTRAAELASDRIVRLVYVSAFVPVGLGSPAAYGALPEARTGHGEGLFVGNPAELGAVRINPRGADAYLRQLHDAYYNDVAYDDFLPYALSLTPDLPISFWVGEVRASRERWGRLPRTFVRCTEDRALSPALQDRMIVDADRLAPDNRFQVESLASSHSPFASRPDELAAILARSADAA